MPTTIVVGTITLTGSTLTFHPSADFHAANTPLQNEVFDALADFFTNTVKNPAPADATQVASNDTDGAPNAA